MLLNIYANDLYHWITGDYLSTIEKSIPYKLLLQLSLGLASAILVCLAFLITFLRDSHRTSRADKALTDIPVNIQGVVKDVKQIDRQVHVEGIKKLQYLSANKKKILKTYFNEGTKRKIWSAFIDPVQVDMDFDGLVKDEILQKTELGGNEVRSAYSVADWAWRYLKEHPEHLE